MSLRDGMRPYEIIVKKREGMELSEGEIAYLVKGYTEGQIPDYQMAAWCMAVYFRGMTSKETTDLTMAIARSGHMLDLSSVPGLKFDKHSTGGVGDKITLILGPLVAAAGVSFAKMSGRGLGHTGGTVDKLESIPGFRTVLSEEEFLRNLKDIGIVLAGQTANLVPADKKLYALRDVTGTVESIPLIASSVMSKKIASGADGILLDVKVGKGAFMKTKEEASRLAELCVQIGKGVGRKVSTFLTDMNQPLGRAVGNILEVKEAIEVLKGEGPRDVLELSLLFGAAILEMAGVAHGDSAKKKAEDLLISGKAFDKFVELVEAQGGDVAPLYEPHRFQVAPILLDVKTIKAGYIRGINAEKVGLISGTLGAGRMRKEDVIDPRVGIILHKKIGDNVEIGEPLATIHGNNDREVARAAQELLSCYQISHEKLQPPPLVIE